MFYNFKIQWAFNNNKGDLKNLFNVINSIGAKSLDRIDFRDTYSKKIDSYKGFIMFDFNNANIETIKYIKKTLRDKNLKISYIELLKK
jgi:hypothetical protein